MVSGKPNAVRTVVILGGGTAGTLIANRLVRRFPRGDVRVCVVDQDDAHVYQPGLLFVPFGTVATPRLTRSRRRQLLPAVDFVRAAIDRVDTEGRRVYLLDASPLSYDVLVIATGARLVPDETDGLVSALHGNAVHTFYESAAATRLAGALADFRRGRLVVNVVDLPIKCPVAPLEFCFLADDHFRRRGVRDDVAIAYSTPLDSAFTKPAASRALAGLLKAKGIELVTEFNTGTVDGDGRRLISYDGRELPFDLAVVVPLHSGSAYVQRSGDLGDQFGFVPVDEHTLQSVRDERVFAAGDAAAVPASKAGSVAHFEGAVVVANIAAYLTGRPPPARFDGHTNCFIETGAGQALLIDFNYDTEPLPGSYPGRPGLPLLRESRLNHLGKRAFEQLYWRVILPGRDIPGITSAMPQHGKRLPIAVP